MAPVLTTAYNDAAGYVAVSATGLPSAADYAIFEVSSDQVRWSAVRGAELAAITSNAASCRDYEFSAGVASYYRVRAVDTAAPTFVAAGAAVSANNAAVSPTVPAGYAEGDLLVIWAAIRSTAGAITTPAGWTPIWTAGHAALLGRRASAAESAPSVAVTGGAAGDDVIAQMACWRNLELTAVSVAAQLNPSAQNIAVPALPAVQSSWAVILQIGWKQDDWTSVGVLTGATEIGEPSSIVGNDAGLVWDYRLPATPVAVAADTFTVTGGAAAISRAAALAFRRADYVTQAITSITPQMSRVWLKFPEAPYLNQAVTFTGWSDNTRTSRVGFYSLLAKRDSGAYFDVASPYTLTITIWAQDDDERRTLDLILSYAGAVFLHLPPTVALESLYAGIGTYRWDKPSARSHQVMYTIPLTEVSRPAPAVVGHPVTWATLLTLYGSWAEVLAAHPTWASVLTLEGSPEDLLITI